MNEILQYLHLNLYINGFLGSLQIFEHNWIIETAAVVTFMASYEGLKELGRTVYGIVKARKYNISGEYIAYYDDQLGQHSVRQHSHLTLTQRGTKIYGKDRTNQRVWSLDGQLHHGHLIVGSYKEISHRDSRSVGSFFVAQDGTMDFDGFWSGWDEINNKLAVGKYTFRRRPTRLYVDSFTPNDRPRIAHLSQRAFGHRYFDTGIENKLSEYKDSAKLLVARSKGDQNNVLGFSLCYMLPKHGLSSFLNIEHINDNPVDVAYVTNNITDDMVDSDKLGKIGVIQTLCVADEMRDRGVGRDLFEQTEKQLCRFSPAIILGPAWNIAGHMNASKILDSFGYKEYMLIRNYWKKDCDDRKFLCPSRSDDECKCEMSLFKKTL